MAEVVFYIDSDGEFNVAYNYEFCVKKGLDKNEYRVKVFNPVKRREENIPEDRFWFFEFPNTWHVEISRLSGAALVCLYKGNNTFEFFEGYFRDKYNNKWVSALVRLMKKMIGEFERIEAWG